MIEAAEILHAFVQRIFARVTERRMAKVVSERERFGKILIEPETPRERAGDLRDLKRVRQARSEVIALRGNEHLRLVLQAPESGRMDDPVAIAPEGVTARRLLLGEQAAARAGRIRRE
jgi:hypothetical protein